MTPSPESVESMTNKVNDALKSMLDRDIAAERPITPALLENLERETAELLQRAGLSLRPSAIHVFRGVTLGGEQLADFEAEVSVEFGPPEASPAGKDRVNLSLPMTVVNFRRGSVRLVDASWPHGADGARHRELAVCWLEEVCRPSSLEVKLVVDPPKTEPHG